MGSKVIRNVTKILKATSGRLFGRVTSGTGRAEELTAADVRTMLSVSTDAANAALFAAIGHTHGGVYSPVGHGHSQSDIANLTTDLSAKQATLVSGTNIKTINSTSLLGSGNIAIGSPKGFRAVANHYYHAQGINSFGTGVSMSANTLYFLPFRFRSTETWAKIHAYVNAAASGGNLRLGIWCPDDSGDGLSTSSFTLISDCGAVSMATTGLKEITGLSVSIDANKIYLLSLLSDQAWTALGASLSTAGAQGVEWLTFGQTSAFNFYLANQFTKSLTYGALPSTITGATLTAANIPAIGLRL